MRIAIRPIAIEAPVEQLFPIGARAHLDAGRDIAIGIQLDVLGDRVLQRHAQRVHGSGVGLLEYLDMGDVCPFAEPVQRNQELIGLTGRSVAVRFHGIAFVDGHLDEAMVRRLDAVQLETVSLEGDVDRSAHAIGPMLGARGISQPATGPSAVVGAAS